MTKNFTRKELECNCGCGGVTKDNNFLYNLQRVRDRYGKPMVISSGYRCPDYNDKVSKTGRTGPHTIAAVDILVSGEDAYHLLGVAMVHGFEGIGVNQKGPHSTRYIHLDSLTGDLRPNLWSY